MQSRLRLFSLLSALLLLACGNFLEARAQTTPSGLQPNPAVEQWIRQQIAQNTDAHVANAFPEENKRLIGAEFLFELLKNPPLTPSGPPTKILISEVKVVGDLYATFLEIPYELVLSKCTFLGNLSFSESNLKKDFWVAGSTFANFVSFRGTAVGGTFNLEDCHFNNDSRDPNEFVDFEYMHIGRNLSIENSYFRGNVSFLRSDVGKIFAAENAVFLNPQAEAKFEGIKVEGEFQIRGARIDCPTNFLSAKTGTFDAEGTHFNCYANLYDMTINGNAVFERAEFASGLSLARTDIVGNLEFTNVRAESPEFKDFSVVKSDNLIFRNNNVASPYSLNGLSYRLLFANPPELLRFIGGAEYHTAYSDVYQNLEGFYRQRHDLENAKAVHIAWKKRERAVLWASTSVWDKFRYSVNLIDYVTTGYGQHLEMALLWSVGLIALGFFVFRKKEWMQATGNDQGSRGKYHPLWYSIALFLPIVSLQDKDNWTPKANRRKSRFYMRLHIILGYLLIPIGFAGWTGLV